MVRVLLWILDRLEEILIGSLMAGATLIIFASVLYRYGSGIPVLYPYLHQIHFRAHNPPRGTS